MKLLRHKFDHNGKTYLFFHDDLHETRGSYAYDTEEETKRAEEEELSKLASGEWVVVYCHVFESCSGVLPTEGQALHCDCCKDHGSKYVTDSLFGIVIENTDEALENFVKQGGI